MNQPINPGDEATDEGAPQDRAPTQHAHPQPESQPPPPRRLCVELPSGIYNRARARAACDGLTLPGLARALIAGYLHGTLRL